jgi:hypothetical protein
VSLAMAVALAPTIPEGHLVARPACGPRTNLGCGNEVVGNPLWLELMVVVLVIAIVAACIAFWRTLHRG